MRDSDDVPVFRPQFGKKARAGQTAASPRFRNAVLALIRSGSAARSKAPARARIAVRSAANSSRRVIVKVHVAPLRGGGQRAAALHLRYIQRDGVEKDGSPGVLYGPVAASAPDVATPRAEERHQFRIVVSPEDAGELELSEYVRRLMSQVERDLGLRLEWAAVNHFNTEHPHAHIVVRGVDRDGREVRLPRTYIARGLRDRARQLATEELGPRPEVDLARQRQREVKLDRFTELDRTLERRATANRVELGPTKANDRARQAESFLIGRLQHLQTLRLAERVAPRSWVLTEGWVEHLRELGMRGDIIKQMHLALRADPSRYEIVRGAGTGPQSEAPPNPIVGRVVSKGLSDELRGSYYAVIEKPDGAGAYVPISASAAEQMRTGDIVQIASTRWKWRRREDGEIHQQARANGGVYEAPNSEPSKIASQFGNVSFHLDQKHDGTYRRAPMVHDATTSYAKRLVELEKLGLAARDGAGRWRVDDALLAKLDAKDESEPRTRLVVERQRCSVDEQVKQLAPVWLDELAAESLATYGFGAELRVAVAQRAASLREHGIDLADPTSRQQLREAERDGLAHRIRREHGGQDIQPVVSPFRGTVVRLHDAPGGGVPYAEVRRGDRFVVVAVTPGLRTKLTVGRAASVAIDADGRAMVRTPRWQRGRGDLS